jgi:hypothetical protein
MAKDFILNNRYAFSPNKVPSNNYVLFTEGGEKGTPTKCLLKLKFRSKIN